MKLYCNQNCDIQICLNITNCDIQICHQFFICCLGYVKSENVEIAMQEKLIFQKTRKN